jgi:Tfp pilus assembly protein PilZ
MLGWRAAPPTSCGLRPSRYSKSSLNDYVPGANPPPLCGTALVAHPDDQSRRRLGWVLRRAGYDLAFASTRQELAAATTRTPPTLIVVAEELLPSQEPCVAAQELRTAMGQPDLPLLVVSEHPWKAVLWRQVPRACAIPARCRDRLLFQISELTRPPAAELRATPRIFFSAFCAFRRTDQMVPTYAVTYNISAGGLFVRTLDPPATGSLVAINLRLPNAGEPVVTVYAKVVWVQRPTHGSTGPTPDGFGAQILDEHSPTKDLEAYRSACKVLHAETVSGARFTA